MGLFDRFKKRKLELYTEKELDELEVHIEEYVGEFNQVLHEIYSPDIHLDIAVIKPTEDRPYYSLVTMGLGAHHMNVPKELKEYELERCELIIDLPSSWDINNNEEKWYWPIRWLKIIARVPIEHHTWIGYGHTFGDGTCFDETVNFTSIVLVKGLEKDLRLSDGKKINFYKLIPLYSEELDYKQEHDGIDDFLDIADGLSTVIDINRKNYCK